MPTVAPLDLDGHVLAVEFLGDVPFFANANGTYHRLEGSDKVIEAHQGMLTAIRDPYSESLISGGEDGKAVLEILFAAYESAGAGRKILLPSPTRADKPIDLWKK